jgi:hypothetical protein
MSSMECMETASTPSKASSPIVVPPRRARPVPIQITQSRRASPEQDPAAAAFASASPQPEKNGACAIMLQATVHADDLRREENLRLAREREEALAAAASVDENDEELLEDAPLERKVRRSVSWSEDIYVLHEIQFKADEVVDDDRGDWR